LYYKTIISGNVVEVYEYENEPVYRGKVLTDDDDLTYYLLTGDESHLHASKKKHDRLDSINASDDDLSDADLLRRQLYKEFNRKKMTLFNGRTRRANFRRLVTTNFSSCNFITLTFRDSEKEGFDITDIASCNLAFDKFMKRLRRAFPTDFKFLVVVEFQKRGAVHYHMLADLGLEFLGEEHTRWYERYFQSRYWKHGFVDIKAVDHVDNLGAYISKYMSKDMDDRLKGKKAYRASGNLDRPIVFKGDDTGREIIDTYFEKNEEAYTSSYTSDYLGIINYYQYNLTRS